MSFIQICELCKSDAIHEYHSTYKGHPIEVGVSLITKRRHYHSNQWESDTLKGIRERIALHESGE